MEWKKLGQFFVPDLNSPYTHVMFPVVEILDENQGLIRVYYTHRDQDNYGFPTYLEAAITGENHQVVYNHDEPIMARATLGHFDDSGVNPTSLVKTDRGTLLYYYGWNLGVTVPFRNSIGVAIQEKGAVFFTRLFSGAILDRSKNFPHLCATPCVLWENNVYKMWFASGDPWLMVDGQPQIACHVGYAESADGIDWVRQTAPAVPSGVGGDHVVSTPCVRRDGDLYRMWYSYRGAKYRIGYAESEDGKTFARKDAETGITVSDRGWDSEMVCYPCVFDLGDRRYMLYCGNAYGKTGLGLAILQDGSRK